jgi:hypothetical protein
MSVAGPMGFIFIATDELDNTIGCAYGREARIHPGSRSGGDFHSSPASVIDRQGSSPGNVHVYGLALGVFEI